MTNKRGCRSGRKLKEKLRQRLAQISNDLKELNALLSPLEEELTSRPEPRIINIRSGYFINPHSYRQAVKSYNRVAAVKSKTVTPELVDLTEPEIVDLTKDTVRLYRIHYY